VLRDYWERMATFCDFSEAGWKYLGTQKIMESPFASVRQRTTRAVQRYNKVESATALIWKLLTVAEKRFRRLDALHLPKDVYEGRKFVNGKPVPSHQRKVAA
jgi:transposase-like protein